MIIKLKHQIVKFIEKLPLIQIFIYNNLKYFSFLFAHDKDYYALKLLINKNDKRVFIDVGGNIGLSSIGFRELGFKNRVLIFEPDKSLINKYLKKIKKNIIILLFIHLDYQIAINKKDFIEHFIKIIFFILIIALV